MAKQNRRYYHRYFLATTLKLTTFLLLLFETATLLAAWQFLSRLIIMWRIHVQLCIHRSQTLHLSTFYQHILLDKEAHVSQNTYMSQRIKRDGFFFSVEESISAFFITMITMRSKFNYLLSLIIIPFKGSETRWKF